jgi:hypothetical protein
MIPTEKDNVITAITVSGYKSIYNEQPMEIRPLTILAGANSSGKSSFMQPVLLMKQTLESSYDPGVFRLNGPNVRFTSSDQILSKIQRLKELSEFSIGYEREDKSKLVMTYNKVEGKGFDIRQMKISKGEAFEASVSINSTEDELKKILFQIPFKVSHDWHWTVIRERCFLDFVFGPPNVPKEGKIPLRSTPFPQKILFYPQNQIEGIIHVPGLRGNPERNYNRTTSVGPNFPGTFESYVASVISQWQTDSPSKIDKLGGELEKLGLTWKVEAKSLDDTQVELRVGRLPHSQRGGAYDMVSIADVGFGVSQTLPVLVALLVAQPNQIVYIEQPEIHLHPIAQRHMAHVLADAAKRGVRVVVETHSSLLLREVQTLVAEGEMDNKLSNSIGSSEMTTAQPK